MNCQQQTLSEFITSVAPGTEDILSHLGVQTKRYILTTCIVTVAIVTYYAFSSRVYGLTKSQCSYLQSIKLVHLCKTLKLLVEWLELGMYDFCSLSFAMKVHLSEKSKHVLHQTLMGSHGLGIYDKNAYDDVIKLSSLGVSKPIKSIQELKCFQTLLVRSESLLRNAVHTNLAVSHSGMLFKNNYYYY